jgi:ribosomal protein S18 acetylase RimI-like enzyme
MSQSHPPLNPPLLTATRTTDLARVRAVLQQDPITTAYMLGDLDPVYSHYCAWWVAARDGTDVAIVLVYTGFSAPVVLTFGETAGIAAIFEHDLDAIPQRALVHLLPEHLAVVAQYFHLERLRPMLRMGLRSAHFRPHMGPIPPGYSAPTRLSHRDTGDIMGLFQYYPDHFFEPHQLTAGHYYGLRAESDDARLLAVAGIHVVSKSDRVAAIGNIVTHPDHRGRGLSTLCTSMLVMALIDEGVELLALNVERKNSSAVRVYEKLGFREHVTYLEGFLVRTLTDRTADLRVGR